MNNLNEFWRGWLVAVVGIVSGVIVGLMILVYLGVL